MKGVVVKYEKSKEVITSSNDHALAAFIFFLISKKNFYRIHGKW